MDRNAIGEIASAAGCRALFDEPLSGYTGFRTGGPAACMLLPETPGQLKAAVRGLKGAGEQFFLMGNGSNLVAPDEGYPGAVVCTRNMRPELSADGRRILCSAGARLRDLCECAASSGLSGAEFAFGIPGTVGGAVFMNAGAYGGEIKDILLSVRALCPDGSEQEFPADCCGLGYRTSAFQAGGYVILEAAFELAPDRPESIRRRMEDFMSRRRDKQPLNLPSCGSTFKRPEGAFAGALIEQCGLRGFSVGGAAVSEKHCGFVVNRGGATTADIIELINRVRETVLEKTGYLLECEVRFMGR